jgi:hypothetical protein
MVAGARKKWWTGLALVSLWMGLQETSAEPVTEPVARTPLPEEVDQNHRVVPQPAQEATDTAAGWAGSDTSWSSLDTAADTGSDTGTAEEEPVTTQLQVTVIDSNGEIVDYPATVILSCSGIRKGSGAFHRPHDGHEFPMHIEWSDLNLNGCSIRASREDGLLDTWSDSVELSPEDGPEVEIELVLPVEPTGGLGIQIVAHELGILATWVIPGSPAAVAGMKEGDIISSIEGQDTQGMRTDTFVELGTGTIGSWVEFSYLSIESDLEDETAVRVRRQWLE